MTEALHYKQLERAVVRMALCNGCINRDREEVALVDEFRDWLADQRYEAVTLDAWCHWLGHLTEDQLDTLVDGEETEMEALVLGAPQPTLLHKFLDDVFNEVL